MKSKTHNYLLRGIPLTLWRSQRHRAIREGITMREVILRALARDAARLNAERKARDWKES